MREVPYFALRYPDQAIEYVGFDVERKAFGGAYLSARYESLKEEGDFTLQRYLTGIVTLNPGEEELKAKTVDEEVTRRVMKDLELERFLDKPVNMLSNGQSRRARIGKALLTRPEVLCLDAPFIGLDPIVTQHISRVLHRLAEASTPRIVLSLRPQDAIPEWITHIVYAGEDGKVDSLGPKEEVFQYLKRQYDDAEKSIKTSSLSHELDAKLVELREVGRHLSERGDFESNGTDASGQVGALSRDGYKKVDDAQVPVGEPIVEMQGVNIKYGANSVLGEWKQNVNGEEKEGLFWEVHRGQRWGIFGANGSGKTTLISLVTSDHPQTYSAPVKLFQRSRLPEPGKPGITIFEIQARMGHASPEVHALFPKRLTIRRALESAWSETPITKARLDENATERVEACLRWFEPELNPLHKDGKASNGNLDWASNVLFGESSYSAQRVLLFLRATIRNPDIVILDEAFSGMDDLARDKCLLFLSRGVEIARLRTSISLQHTVHIHIASLTSLRKMSPRALSTAVIEAILSNEAGLHTTLEEAPLTPTLHAPAPPTHLAFRAAPEQPGQEQERPQSQSQSRSQGRIAEGDTTSVVGTRSRSRLSPPSSILAQSTATTSLTTGTTTTVITVIRAHRPAHTFTLTSYVDQWPQIGFVPSESDVPAQWRETYEMKALR
ncbi:hypothetical protein E8E12_009366 [Didymella heteroderae]|uniref:ABC transporter domain-containing protein n=1 Tax=Didymella heteroderae TaxID=1769908 RepID=A0A9P5C4A2_9PLEO|nr:hypothetical protein E8E12_009366 [Didymella heteroderae]